MIPKNYILAWQEYAPWQDITHVEQDLLISRVLVELFSNPLIKEALAFRGGTALYKLFIQPTARYSEDIDLVQVHAAPIGEILDALRSVVDPILGEPKRKFSEGRATLIYRYIAEVESQIPMRLKIEINTREHFSMWDLCQKNISINSRWFSGQADILTYQLDELIGTKLRALYQRKKGRDLFDLWIALQHREFNADNAVKAFLMYMAKENKTITRALFEKNLAEKLTSTVFLQDITYLLAPTIKWNIEEAIHKVKYNLISKLPGKPWEIIR